MGWTTLSERELQRIQVLSELMNRVRTLASASVVLALSTRQVHRLLKAYRLGGAGGLAHKARSRSSNNRIREDVRNRAVQLVRGDVDEVVIACSAEIIARHPRCYAHEDFKRGVTAAAR